MCALIKNGHIFTKVDNCVADIPVEDRKHTGIPATGRFPRRGTQ